MSNFSCTKRISCMSSLLLRRIHAGGRLVEKQKLGLRGEGADDLQPALVAVGQRLAVWLRATRVQV